MFVVLQDAGSGTKVQFPIPGQSKLSPSLEAGARGLGVEVASSAWAPKGWAGNHGCPEQAVSTRGSMQSWSQKGKSRVFSAKAEDKTIHPSLASKGEERMGQRCEKATIFKVSTV